MKQSQKLAIGLAIAITMFLSLVVAMICSAAMQRGASAPNPEATPPADSTTQPSPDVTSPAVEALRFVSMGNGDCVVAGIGSCTDPCVVIPAYAPSGERVVEIVAMAFYGCESMTSVQIPATVQKIGSLAFAACKNLGYISVAPENPFYRDLDGVLYTADESTLILYPPCRVGSTVKIYTGTTAIADMAFFDCANLSHVAYAGSAEDWERISIGIRNHSLTAASKSFAGSTASTASAAQKDDFLRFL